jgi:hypothetical protein
MVNGFYLSPCIPLSLNKERGTKGGEVKAQISQTIFFVSFVFLLIAMGLYLWTI